MNKQYTVSDIIDLLDRNRSGGEYVQIYDVSDCYKASRINTASIALDLMGDKLIDSIGVTDNELAIYLTDEEINGYWESNSAAAQAKAKEMQAAKQQAESLYKAASILGGLN